jgi:hypothetical protein
MQIETLNDVLHWTKEFHKQLSRCLKHCADENQNTRAQMLLTYLVAHEDKLTEAVAQFEQWGDSSALNTWCYEYLDKHPIVQHEHCNAPFAELDAEQIMAIIVEQHQQVIELYRNLFSRADIPSARELLRGLKSLEEHEAMQMSHAANRLHDL